MEDKELLEALYINEGALLVLDVHKAQQTEEIKSVRTSDCIALLLCLFLLDVL